MKEDFKISTIVLIELIYFYVYKFVVYSVDILFAMCTIKLQNMSCFNKKSPTLIVGDIKGKQQNC